MVVSVVASLFFLAIRSYPLLAFSLVVSVFTLWYVFHDSMNVVQHAGRVYWIVRDNGMSYQPIFCMGFMRQTDPPWLRGSGPQVRLGKHILQIGVLNKRNEGDGLLDEDTGLLEALEGYYMDASADEIRRWP